MSDCRPPEGYCVRRLVFLDPLSEYPVEGLDPQPDGDLADVVAEYLGSMLRSQFETGVLSWSFVEDAARVAAELGGKFPAAQFRLIDALAAIAQGVANAGWTRLNRGRRFLYRSLVEGIRR